MLAHAAAQVKAALDATIALSGENYVFWGGREGYMSLLNTNMKREKGTSCNVSYTRQKIMQEAMALKEHFLLSQNHANPPNINMIMMCETVIGFLRQYDLMNDFKLNVEVNHATLAGHTFTHELQVAADAGLLGSMDANRGDYQNGWDTDQFPNNINELTEAMLIILEAGGFAGGGINFDAKIRRNSTDPEDLFYAHIGGMDAFARALIIADNILQNLTIKNSERNVMQVL